MKVKIKSQASHGFQPHWIGDPDFSKLVNTLAATRFKLACETHSIGVKIITYSRSECGPEYSQVIIGNEPFLCLLWF